MRQTLPSLIAILIVATLAPLCHAQEILESIDDALTWSDGSLQADLSFLQDTELYITESQAPGLIESTSTAFVQPRLAAFLDLEKGDQWRLHGQARLDRGFDPGYAPDGEVRLDEYYLLWRPTGDDRLQLRVGKFATVFGSYPRRNLSWDNPFVTAPTAYEDLLSVSDDGGPGTVDGFLNRRALPANKRTWLPIIWGPAYITGAAISGRIEDFDYAFEIKTAAPSAQPDRWDAIVSGFDAANFAGRLGWRPSPEWNVGFSGAQGPYLRPESSEVIPPQESWRDYEQTTLGTDIAYAHGHWQLWAEIIGAKFEVPSVGSVKVLTTQAEAKYKLTATTWAALRLSQAFFDEAPSTNTDWGLERWRIDCALGHRFSRNLQAKLQYSYSQRSGEDPEGDHLFATQLTVRF